MTQLDEPSAPQEPQDLPEEIVQWQPHHGRTFALPHGEGAVVVAATVGALALLGLTAGAYLAGRASRRSH